MAEQSSERERIAAFIMREGTTRYGSQGKANVEEALESIAQLVRRGEHDL